MHMIKLSSIRAALASFVLLLGIMAIVLIYIKFAGSEALMGDEEAPA